MILKNTIYVCMMSILLLMATQVRSQTTHIVDNNPNTAADFTDLQNAINAAADNDTIYVQQSDIDYGNITLNKSLIIIGRSHNDSSYKSQVNDITIPSDGSNSTIKGLDILKIEEDTVLNETLSNLEIIDCEINAVRLNPNPFSGQDGFLNNILLKGNIVLGAIRIRANNVEIINNVIRNHTFSDVSISPSSTIFSNNIVTGSYEFILYGTGGLLTISNCIFVTESGSTETINFDLDPLHDVEVINSITYNYGSGDLNFEMGNQITLMNTQENVDPLFTFLEGGGANLASNVVYEPELDDLTLQSSSPVVDDGLYEGYDFIPLGTPTGFPSVKIDAYDSTVPVNGNLNVTITTKAN